MRNAVKFNLIKFTNRQADKRSNNANNNNNTYTNNSARVSHLNSTNEREGDCLFIFTFSI